MNNYLDYNEIFQNKYDNKDIDEYNFYDLENKTINILKKIFHVNEYNINKDKRIKEGFLIENELKKCSEEIYDKLIKIQKNINIISIQIENKNISNKEKKFLFEQKKIFNDMYNKLLTCYNKSIFNFKNFKKSFENLKKGIKEHHELIDLVKKIREFKRNNNISFKKNNTSSNKISKFSKQKLNKKLNNKNIFFINDNEKNNKNNIQDKNNLILCLNSLDKKQNFINTFNKINNLIQNDNSIKKQNDINLKITNDIYRNRNLINFNIIDIIEKIIIFVVPSNNYMTFINKYIKNFKDKNKLKHILISNFNNNILHNIKNFQNQNIIISNLKYIKSFDNFNFCFFSFIIKLNDNNNQFKLNNEKLDDIITYIYNHFINNNNIVYYNYN